MNSCPHLAIQLVHLCLPQSFARLHNCSAKMIALTIYIVTHGKRIAQMRCLTIWFMMSCSNATTHSSGSAEKMIGIAYEQTHNNPLHTWVSRIQKSTPLAAAR